MSRRATLLLAAAVAAGCASLAASFAFAWLDHRSSPTLALEQGVPAEASVDEVRRFAKTEGGTVYWAGAPAAQRLELTDTEAGTFIRYLPEEAEVGDKRSRYLTVATYVVPRAFAVATKAARRPGAVERALPNAGIVVWQAARPTSVYLAHRGSNQLVEVFDPNPRRARDLILSGRVRPVPVG
jgi:hypothetical protein